MHTSIALTSSNEASFANPLKYVTNRAFFSASKRSEGISSIAPRRLARSIDSMPFLCRYFCALSAFGMACRAFNSFSKTSDVLDEKGFFLFEC